MIGTFLNKISRKDFLLCLIFAIISFTPFLFGIKGMKGWLVHLLPGLMFGMAIGINNFRSMPMKIILFALISVMVWFAFYKLTFFIDGMPCFNCHDEGYLDISDFPIFFADFANKYPSLVRFFYYSAITGYLPATVLLFVAAKMSNLRLTISKYIILVLVTIVIHFAYYIGAVYIIIWQMVVGVLINTFISDGKRNRELREV